MVLYYAQRIYTQVSTCQKVLTRKTNVSLMCDSHVAVLDVLSTPCCHEVHTESRTGDGVKSD